MAADPSETSRAEATARRFGERIAEILRALASALAFAAALAVLAPEAFATTPGALLTAFAAALGVAVWVAFVRLRDLTAVEEWLDRLAGGEDPGRPPAKALGYAPRLGRALLNLRKRTLERDAAVEAERHWRDAAADVAPEPMATLDERARVRTANASAKRVLGIETGVALSLAIRSPALRDAVRDALAEPERSPRVVIAAKSEIEANGRIYACRVAPVRGPGGGRGVALAFRDRTDAARLAAMRRDFVADLSHEIKTPLSAISLAIETLRGPARRDPEALETFLALLDDEAAFMRQLVDDLTSLSKVQADDTPMAPVDMNAALSRLERRFRPLIEAAGMRLDLEVDEALGAMHGDEAQIERLIGNLIDNAKKYGRSRVELRARRTERDGAPWIEVAVVDDGPGVEAAHLPRLTERFYRADAARTRKKAGAGLGLALAKHIARRHRGALTITSEPGNGARFAFGAPAARASHQSVTIGA